MSASRRPPPIRTGWPPPRRKNLQFPVYGAVHGSNQNGFLGVVTGGETYAGFEVSPAGVKIDFHWMSPVFLYREQYRQSTGSGTGFDVIQKTPNTVNAEVTYTLLSGDDANYAGMALRLPPPPASQAAVCRTRPPPSDHIPVYIQALMADQAKSLFGRSTKVFTTLQDVTGWVDRLRKQDIGSLVLSLYGFEQGGIQRRKSGQL